MVHHQVYRTPDTVLYLVISMYNADYSFFIDYFSGGPFPSRNMDHVLNVTALGTYGSSGIEFGF